jgi:hypothetical protein
VLEVSAIRGAGGRAFSRWGTGYHRFYLTGYTFWCFGGSSQGVEGARRFV